MLIKVYTSVGSVVIDVDKSDEIDVLKYQLISLVICNNLDDPATIMFIDYMGRQVNALNDLDESIICSTCDSDLSYEYELWCYNDFTAKIESCCSRNVSGKAEIIQPSYRLLDMGFKVCGRCKEFFDPGLIALDVEQLQPFTCDCEKLIEFGFTHPNASTYYRAEEAGFKSNNVLLSEQFHRFMMRRYLNAAIDLQLGTQPQNRLSHGVEEFRKRIESGMKTVKVYEEAEQQYVARQCIDYEKVNQYIIELQQQQLPSETTLQSAEEILLIALMRWFKCDRFSWCNRPKCGTPNCVATHGCSMDPRGTEQPNAAEREEGWAGRTEVYACNFCHQITRFPRYNNPAYLLKHSPQGRCGEFANAFCLLCRSLGLDARYVLDFTDHVWVEVWIPSLRRYVHCDPCERALDTPLMYEVGWNKRLSHVFSFSRHGVHDASPRYSRKLAELITRRNVEIVPESVAREIIKGKDRELEEYFISRHYAPLPPTSWRTISVLQRFAEGAVGFQSTVTGYDITLDIVQERKRLLGRELEALTLSTQSSWKLEELQGRISGDVQWKVSRGEIGTIPGVDGTICDSGVDRCAIAETAVNTMVTSLFSRPLWYQPNMICTANHSKYGYHDVIGSVDYGCKSGVAEKFLTTIAQPYIQQHCCGSDVECLDMKEVSGNQHGSECVDVIFSTHRVYTEQSSICATIASTPIADYVCGTPCDILYALTGETREAVIARAITLSNESSHILGFSVSTAHAVPYVVFYSDAGYPLSKSQGFVTYYKQMSETSETHCGDNSIVDVETTLEPDITTIEGRMEETCSSISSTDNNLCDGEAVSSATLDMTSAVESSSEHTLLQSSKTFVWNKYYHYLGGGQHGDTQYFDTSRFMDTLLPGPSMECDEFLRSVRLKSVIVTAGVNLVNGIQCIFETRNENEISCLTPFLSQEYCSPLFTSTNDSPTPRVFDLAADDSIVSITVKSGALVDSISFTTKKGVTFIAGGSGGGDSKTIQIPAGSQIVGFFGGTGGHLHNIGIVLHTSSTNNTTDTAADQPQQQVTCLSEDSKPPSVTRHQLLAVCNELKMHECGQLTFHSEELQYHLRHSDVGTLIDITLRLVQNNSAVNVKTCLNGIATYLENILKDVRDVKTQSIKLTNAYFQRTILIAKYGVELLCFGPSGFVLSSDLTVLKSCIHRWLADNSHNNTEFVMLLRSWLRKYIQYLHEIVKIIL